MKIYLEIDSFSSLDYYRIFKTKISEESISQVIDGLILNADFLFKNEIDKIQKIKQIVSNFNIPIMLNPNTNAYYQFETIHPFESGNGRLGRLFPAKILLESGVLSRPCLLYTSPSPRDRS